MSRDDVLAKLVSVRHYCFVRGVLGQGSGRDSGGDGDFRQAFRTANRLYVEVRDGIGLKGQRDAQRPPATRCRRAA
jgi:hypothetical protein